jgi:hypothetical protein
VNKKPKLENLKPFKKGESGNPKGRPPKLPDLDVLMAEVLGEEKDGKTAAQAILAALRAKAAKGDIRAAELLLNRGYGLPKQKVQLSSDPEQPVIFKIDPRFANDNG